MSMSQRPQLRGTAIFSAEDRERFLRRQLESLERDNYTERNDIIISQKDAGMLPQYGYPLADMLTRSACGTYHDSTRNNC
jgi:hypothetical protein